MSLNKRVEESLFLAIVTVGFLVMVVYFSKKLSDIHNLSVKEWAGLFITIAAGVQIYRTSRSLIRNHRSDEEKASSSQQLSEQAAMAIDSHFGIAFRKRPWLVMAIFAFAFSLPVLFQLSAAGAAGRRFTAEDWWFVIGGEIFIGICMVLAWRRVKRLLEKRKDVI